MSGYHNIIDYKVVPENRISGVTDKEVLEKRKRGVKAMNTRCFKCNKSFQQRIGYKNHLRKRHDGIEPPENRDPANLARPDDRIDCLICDKKFTSVLGLKLHINRLHLGLQADNEEEEDEDEDEDGENKTPKPKTDSEDLCEEDRRLIERMYYRMRKYACKFCPARFNDKMKFAMHEAVHAQSKKPVMCPYCEKSYSRRDKLREHIGRSHLGMPMPEPIPRRNEIVGLISRDMESPEPIRTKYTIDDYVMVEGRFKCPECSTLFLSFSGVELHVREEHTEKGFKCQICLMAYIDKKGLYQHMFRKHPKQPMGMPIENPFVMSSLNKAPTYSSPETPEKDSNIQPIRLADGTLKCPLCPKTYSSQGGFWIHKKNHHGPGAVTSAGPNSQPFSDLKKKFWCEVCGKYYSSYTSLYIHRKNLHPMESPRPGATFPRVITDNVPMVIPPKSTPLVVNVGGGSMHTQVGNFTGQNPTKARY